MQSEVRQTDERNVLDARVFRAAPNYYRYRLTLWTLKQVVAAVGLARAAVRAQQQAE